MLIRLQHLDMFDSSCISPDPQELETNEFVITPKKRSTQISENRTDDAE